jgi:hypothetical protein
MGKNRKLEALHELIENNSHLLDIDKLSTQVRKMASTREKKKKLLNVDP